MKRNNALFLFTFIFILILSSCGTTKRVTFSDIAHPKREFRGAWLSTAWQSRYKTMNSAQMKAYFTGVLNELQAQGINAVIFQARPYADAFYKSNLEP